MVVARAGGGLVWSAARIYLGWGFGISARETAEDLAVIRLVEKAQDVLEMRSEPGTQAQFREILIRFLRACPAAFVGGSTGGVLDFSVAHSTAPGESRSWTVGPLGDEPEVKIPIPPDAGLALQY